MSLTEFFHMGGYAFYVWTSYAIALVILGANLVLPAWQHRGLLCRIARRMRRESLQQ
jgi:heme exporter protein D